LNRGHEICSKNEPVYTRPTTTNDCSGYNTRLTSLKDFINVNCPNVCSDECRTRIAASIRAFEACAYLFERDPSTTFNSLADEWEQLKRRCDVRSTTLDVTTDNTTGNVRITPRERSDDSRTRDYTVRQDDDAFTIDMRVDDKNTPDPTILSIRFEGIVEVENNDRTVGVDDNSVWVNEITLRASDREIKYLGSTRAVDDPNAAREDGGQSYRWVQETRFGVGDSSSVTHTFSTAEVTHEDELFSERVSPDGVTFVSSFTNVPRISDDSNLCVAISIDWSGDVNSLTPTATGVVVDRPNGKIEFRARDKVDCVETRATLKVVCRLVSDPVGLRDGTAHRRICFLCPISENASIPCDTFAIDPEIYIPPNNNTNPSTSGSQATNTGTTNPTTSTTPTSSPSTTTVSIISSTVNQPTSDDSSSTSLIVSIIMFTLVLFF